MLRKLIETFTTQTGSLRGDAKLLASIISRRASIAFDLGKDEAFSEIHRESCSMLERVADESCKGDECKLVFDALIQLQKTAVLMEIKHNIRKRISEIMEHATLPRKFFLDGRASGLSAKEYGIMAVELNFSNAQAMLNMVRNLPPQDDDTSLINEISQYPELALVTFMAIGVGAYIAYAELYTDVPDSIKPDIGSGVREGIEKRQGNTDVLLALIGKFSNTVLYDLRHQGPAGTAYTRTNSDTIEFLSQKYSGNEEVTDLDGLDSVTLGPLIDMYYLNIVMDLRETGRLRFSTE